MEAMYSVCCGADVHKKVIVCCLLRGRRKEIREFGASTKDLIELSSWLQESGCEMIAMESTASYWKPLYNILEAEGIPAMVVNAQHIKALPGRKTDTLDAEGKTSDTCDHLPDWDELIAAIPKFVGRIEQVPPKYSALNIAGRRAYDLARRGAHFVVPKREVEIACIDPGTIVEGARGVSKMTFDVECGSGTYIRSLCRDIALACGSLGCMTALTRTRSGVFTLDDCTRLDDFLADPTAHLVDVAATLEKMMPRVDVDQDTARILLNGRAAELNADGVVAVFCGELLGVARKKEAEYKLDIRLCE